MPRIESSVTSGMGVRPLTAEEEEKYYGEDHRDDEDDALVEGDDERGTVGVSSHPARKIRRRSRLWQSEVGGKARGAQRRSDSSHG